MLVLLLEECVPEKWCRKIINKQLYDITDVKNRLPISEIIVRNIIIPTMVHDIVLTICRTFDSISNYFKHH